MDPQIILKLLEGREDVITPLAEKHEQIYQNAICPTCAGDRFEKIGDARRLFRPGKPFAHYQLECCGCGCQFDPHSGIVIKSGNLAEAIEPAIPIIQGED